MIKIISFFIVAFLFSITGFAQDTIPIETAPMDTVQNKSLDDELNVSQPDNSAAVVQPEQTPEQSEKESKFDKSKMYFGGYLNLTFGSYTAIGVEPLVGYKITPKFSVGGKISYTYVNDKRYSEDYSSSNYGFSLFTRYRFTSNLYGHAEYSAMNYKLFDSISESYRDWVSFLYLGGGFSQPISKNTWVTAQVLFDVLQDENSPYSNWEPFFSVGVGVGF